MGCSWFHLCSLRGWPTFSHIGNWGGHGLRQKVTVLAPSQRPVLVVVWVRVSYNVFLHLENDLVNQRVVQDEQIE